MNKISNMISVTSLIQHLMDKPYKFIMIIAGLTLISSLQYTISDIDMNKVRIASFLIMIYCIGAWIYDDHKKSSLSDDIYHELHGTEEAEIEYNKTVSRLNTIIFLGSIITILIVFTN